MGEETPDEVKERLVIDAIHKLNVELAENAKQPQNELAGWDHKREYRRLRDMATEALRLAVRPRRKFEAKS
jgi:hypothetical protein